MQMIQGLMLWKWRYSNGTACFNSSHCVFQIYQFCFAYSTRKSQSQVENQVQVGQPVFDKKRYIPMNKKYLIGIYQMSKQNNYIVVQALYSYARKPMESESICLGLNPTSKQGIHFHFLTERGRTHLRSGLMSGPSAPQCHSHLA